MKKLVLILIILTLCNLESAFLEESRTNYGINTHFSQLLNSRSARVVRSDQTSGSQASTNKNLAEEEGNENDDDGEDDDDDDDEDDDDDDDNDNYDDEIEDAYARSKNITSNETSDYDIEMEINKLGKVVTSVDLYNLRTLLLAYYDKNSRPILNSSKPLDVLIGVSIIQINNLDEVNQVMTTTLQVSLRWKDEFLTWNASIYPNTIAFKTSEVWTPDVANNDNMNSFKFDKYEKKDNFLIGYSSTLFDFNERDKYMVLCKPSGDCRWVFPIKLMTSCQLNQQYFPFDVQKCIIDFMPSAHYSFQVSLKKFHRGIHLEFKNEGEFELMIAEINELEMLRPILHNSENFTTSVFRITLQMKRKITFYANKIIIPYLVFYVVTQFTYFIPSEAGEKKSYSTSILISVMIYLKDISYYIPKTIIMPLLSIYFNLNFIFVFFCLVISTFIYTIYFLDKIKQPMPKFLANLIAKSSLSKHENRLNEKLIHYEKQRQLFSLTQINQNMSNMSYDQMKVSIKNELNSINKRLSVLDKDNVILIQSAGNVKFLRPSKEKGVKSIVDGKSTFVNDLIAQNTLGLLKTMKEFIKTHEEAKTNDKKLQNRELRSKTSHSFSNEQVLSNALLNDKKLNYKKILKNFHFIDTLETCKLTLVETHLKHNESTSFLSKKHTLTPVSSDSFETIHTKKGKYFLLLVKQYKNQVKLYLEDQYKCLSKENNKTSNDKVTKDTKSQIDSLNPNNQEGNQWKYLSIILDDIVFYFFAIIVPVAIMAMYFKTLSQDLVIKS